MANPSITLWASEAGSLLEPLGTTQFEPVLLWVEIDGKNRPSDRQATLSDGTPIWAAKFVAVVDKFGRREQELITIKVASAVQPDQESFGVAR